MARRRGRVAPRGKGVWQVRVFTGTKTVDDGQGETRLVQVYETRTVHGTKKEAEGVLTSMLGEADRGTLIRPTRETLDAYLDRWLDTAAPQRPNTKAEYAGLLARYLRPVLGMRRLSELRPSDFQGIYNDMTARGLAPRTIAYTHRVVFRALGQAVKWGELPRNPAAGVSLPKARRQEMTALSPEQVRAFGRAAVSSPHGLLFMFLIGTGMRPSEALALRWRDLDLDAGTATVMRVVLGSGAAAVFADPKTARSRRTIPLPASLLVALTRQAEAGVHPDALIFPNEAGQPLNERSVVRRAFKPLLAAAGLPGTIRLYDLRHTCATLMLANGDNAKVVSERLGHSSIVLTLDVYSHVLPNMQQEAAAKLDAFLTAPVVVPALPSGQ